MIGQSKFDLSVMGCLKDISMSSFLEAMMMSPHMEIGPLQV